MLAKVSIQVDLDLSFCNQKVGLSDLCSRH